METQHRIVNGYVYLTYAILGASVLVLALGTGLIKTFLWISEPLFALLVGIAVGPIGLGLLDPTTG